MTAGFLSLRLAPAPADTSLDLLGEPTLTETWCDPQGRIIGSVCLSDGRYRFEILGLAAYCFRDGAADVACFPEAGVAPSVARDTFYRSVLPFVLHTRGLEALHASAVLSGGRVYAFCGPSGMGKSTLVDAFRQRGYALWADDALVLDRRDGVPVAAVVPFHVRLHKVGPAWVSAAREAVPDGVADRFEPAAGLAAPLGAIFILERNTIPDQGPQLDLLDPAEALRQVLTHAYAFTVTGREARRRLVSYFLALIAATPVYRLCVPDDRGRVAATVALLEPMLAAGNGATAGD